MDSLLEVINGNINLETGEFIYRHNRCCPITTEFKGILLKTYAIDDYIQKLVAKNDIQNFQIALGNMIKKRENNNKILNLYGNISHITYTFIPLLRKLLGTKFTYSPCSLITDDLYALGRSEYEAKIIAVDYSNEMDIKWNRVEEFIECKHRLYKKVYGEMKIGKLGNLIIISNENILENENCPAHIKNNVTSINFNSAFVDSNNKLRDMELYLDQFLTWIVIGALN